MKVTVVGGGVIGLCAALDLARRGAEVVLLERTVCGSGASLANGGWVAPALSSPLAEPGAAGHALLAMAGPRSPFKLHLRPDTSLFAWCWRFWRASSASRWRRGASQLLALNARTFQLFDELQDEGASFEMHASGLVFAARTSSSLAAYRALFDSLAQLGYGGQVDQWGRRELREHEPALADGVVGALYAREERHVRPESLVKALVHAATAAGVDVVEHGEVESIVRRSGRWSLSTMGASYNSDAVIVAAGVWSRELLRPLGIRLPLESAKGYSVTSTGAGTVPRHPLYLTEAKVGCSPFADAVRLAGTLELGARDPALRRRRLEAITDSASLYLRDWRPVTPVFEWAGFRPLAPDGLPLIGSLPGYDNLFVATGHGMLGVTLAPATAAILTSLVLENRTSPDLEPFRPDRFMRRRNGGGTASVRAGGPERPLLTRGRQR